MTAKSIKQSRRALKFEPLISLDKYDANDGTRDALQDFEIQGPAFRREFLTYLQIGLSTEHPYIELVPWRWDESRGEASAGETLLLDPRCVGDLIDLLQYYHAHLVNVLNHDPKFAAMLGEQYGWTDLAVSPGKAALAAKQSRRRMRSSGLGK